MLGYVRYSIVIYFYIKNFLPCAYSSCVAVGIICCMLVADAGVSMDSISAEGCSS